MPARSRSSPAGCSRSSWHCRVVPAFESLPSSVPARDAARSVRSSTAPAGRECWPASHCNRLRGSQRPLRIRMVESGQHKSLVYVQSFGKKHARDAPGHLGRYGSAPLGSDIPAGIEQRLWPGVRSVRRCHLHRRRLMHVRVDRARDQERHDQGQKQSQLAFRRFRAALVSLDAQAPEVRLTGASGIVCPVDFSLVPWHFVPLVGSTRLHRKVYRPVPANKGDCQVSPNSLSFCHGNHLRLPSSEARLHAPVYQEIRRQVVAIDCPPLRLNPQRRAGHQPHFSPERPQDLHIGVRSQHIMQK